LSKGKKLSSARLRADQGSNFEKKNLIKHPPGDVVVVETIDCIYKNSTKRTYETIELWGM